MHKFDISKILQKAKVDEATVKLYKQNRVLGISSDCRILYPQLQPKSGLPGDSQIRADHLLGPHSEDIEVGLIPNICYVSHYT